MLVEQLADYEELQRRLGHPAGARAHARHRPHRLPGADVGHRVRAPRRADARARPHRGHAARRARAPDVRRGRARPRRGADGARRDRLRRAWSPSSSRATRTPRTRWCRRRWPRCARPNGRWSDDVRGALRCARGARAARGAGLAAGGERGGRRRRRRRSARASRWWGARSGASRWTRTPTRRRPRLDDRRRRAHAAAARAAATRPRASSPSSTATATPPSGAASCARCRSSTLGDRALYLIDDAIRTNDTRLIAAALGPYATEHLPDAAYDQAVLKCVFVGVPITRLDGIPERVTPDGARMLAAFVHERVAAGRDVPAEVWTVDRPLPAARRRSPRSRRAGAARSRTAARRPSGR